MHRVTSYTAETLPTVPVIASCGGSPDAIDLSNVTLGPPCLDDDDCVNAKPCNGKAVCVEGRCYVGNGTDVDDKLMCTDDMCDPLTGVVTHPPHAVDDGDSCTIDGCTEGTGVWHAPAAANGCPPISGAMSEMAACDAISGKLSDMLVALGCAATLHGCPELMTWLGNEPCSSYDPSTVAGCVHLYGVQTSCDSLMTAAKECKPVSYPPAGGCP